jgi:hypothetical protein
MAAWRRAVNLEMTDEEMSLSRAEPARFPSSVCERHRYGNISSVTDILRILTSCLHSPKTTPSRKVRRERDFFHGNVAGRCFSSVWQRRARRS